MRSSGSVGRRRAGCPSPGPAAGSWPTTSRPPGRPAANPQRAAADAAPGSVRAESPARRPERPHPQRGPGGREGRPGHGIAGPAQVGAAGPGHEPEVAVAVLAGQGGHQAGRQRGPAHVFGPDLQHVLLVGDPRPAVLAVIPPPAAILSVVTGATRWSGVQILAGPLPHQPHLVRSHDHPAQLQGLPDGEVAAAANDPGPAGPTPLLPRPLPPRLKAQKPRGGCHERPPSRPGHAGTRPSPIWPP